MLIIPVCADSDCQTHDYRIANIDSHSKRAHHHQDRSYPHSDDYYSNNSVCGSDISKCGHSSEDCNNYRLWGHDNAKMSCANNCGSSFRYIHSKYRHCKASSIHSAATSLPDEISLRHSTLFCLQLLARAGDHKDNDLNIYSFESARHHHRYTDLGDGDRHTFNHADSVLYDHGVVGNNRLDHNDCCLDHCAESATHILNHCHGWWH